MFAQLLRFQTSTHFHRKRAAGRQAAGQLASRVQAGPGQARLGDTPRESPLVAAGLVVHEGGHGLQGSGRRMTREGSALKGQQWMGQAQLRRPQGEREAGGRAPPRPAPLVRPPSWRRRPERPPPTVWQASKPCTPTHPPGSPRQTGGRPRPASRPCRSPPAGGWWGQAGARARVSGRLVDPGGRGGLVGRRGPEQGAAVAAPVAAAGGRRAARVHGRPPARPHTPG